MIVTEEEAKTKWCPETRTGLSAGMAVNHHIDMTPKGIGVHDETRCVASACMMWRWLEWETDPDTGKRTKGVAGYCGKAGRQ